MSTNQPTGGPTADEPTIDELRQLAERTAHSVGAQVLARRKAGFSWETKSTSTDVVTEIDTWAEAAVVEQLLAARPNDGLLGEEGASAAGTTGIVWVIDPIDGTTNLLYDIPGFNVSIGVEQDGQPVAGAVYDPIRDELFSAGVGQGATRNGERISVSGKEVLATSLVGTGFSYQPDDRIRQATALVPIISKVRDIRRLGGAALDFCNVACGRLDAYFERGLSRWDAAAGAVIASEAGAIVKADDGVSYASAPGIADELIALLDDAGV